MDPLAPSFRLPYVTLDVFTQQRFAGNPLAIVTVPPSQKLSQQQKQTIAREFNLSETVILHERDQADNTNAYFEIDIFMIDRELPFAGHPTVGAACLLATSKACGEGRLITRAGPIAFRYDHQIQAAYLEIPHDVHIHNKQLSIHEATQAGFSELVSKNIVGSSPIVSIVKGMTFALVELPSRNILSAVKTNLGGIKDGLDAPWHGEGNLVGNYFYVVHDASEDGDGHVSLSTRMILGTLEDPATGSAASTLSAYLALRMAMDQSDERPGVSVFKFDIEQGVDMGRESHMMTEVWVDNASNEVRKVVLGGSSVKVMEGHITV